MGNWMDLTLRVQEDCEVEVEADHTVELHWQTGEDNTVTIHVPAEAAKRLAARLSELVVLIPEATAA